MPRRIQFGEGSGSVFADIGVPNPEEALAKAEIAFQVNRILTERGLNQAQAGDLLRIAQPRVSDLARGRLRNFSPEKLLHFARRAGIDVEIRMKPSSKPRPDGQDQGGLRSGPSSRRPFRKGYNSRSNAR
ncbi:MAG: helix-turn-helix transcriptional regulator [Bryobacteraceae bacterium]|jgi:predicted XRE-type DNA-binding protein